MSTTTIRMPDDLKKKVAAPAKRCGTNGHGLILEAIAGKAEQGTLRADFVSVAEQRYAKIVATGKTISWTEMQAYLEARLRRQSGEASGARKLAR